MRYSNHIVDETTHAFKCAKWFALVSSLLLGIFGTVLLIWQLRFLKLWLLQV